MTGSSAKRSSASNHLRVVDNSESVVLEANCVHLWLARNDADGLEAYNRQLYKCSIHSQNREDEKLGVAEAVEFHENTREKMATRSAIRKILRETDPDLLADMLSTEQRDLFARVEKIYSIQKGAAHRPKKK